MSFLDDIEGWGGQAGNLIDTLAGTIGNVADTVARVRSATQSINGPVQSAPPVRSEFAAYGPPSSDGSGALILLGLLALGAFVIARE